MNNNNIKILIPAAGFGTRVGSPPAKELLLREDTQQPLIEWTISQAIANGIFATIITRKNKTVLIEYLQSHPFYLKAFDLFLIDSSTDWQDSLIQSQSSWRDFNMVLLPDTTWQPLNILNAFVHCFKDKKSLTVVAALHPISDFQNWGALCAQQDKSLHWCEKPNQIPEGFELLGAWGIFGFHKKIGKNFLQDLVQSHKSKRFIALSKDVEILSLSYFKDLTR